MAKNFRARAVLSRLLAIAAIALAAVLAAAPSAHAQDPFSDFFEGIFGGPRRAAPSRATEQPRVRRIMPHQENRPPTYWRSGDASRAAKRSKRGEPTDSAAPEKPDLAANYFVAVMGDSFGVLLGNGLEETFADKPEIGVEKKAKENSGLVREDYFDWPKAAKDIASGPQKVDVAVIMIGSNDRQSLRDGTKSEEPFSPRWRELYQARVDAMLAPFREKKITVVWVGLPIMKNESFSADMAKLNDIYRAAVTKDGGVFVDLWEALADERGQFSAFGPDINGQIVKLRTADGVHLTDAGALSVAHFVANEIKKLYEGNHPVAPEQQPTATAPAETPAAPPAPGAPIVFRSPVNPAASNAPALPERPAIGPVQTLSGSAAAASAELARPAPKTGASGADAQALARHVFVDGGDQPSRPNRADDSSWRAPAQ
ncbi:SGNH family hydrolase [Methylocystis echinoides]|uniref:SGNH/GDSL hydrolase family protein n=1 Tax=Methylocystis echinoides TaxID=29468 RepID=UPI003432A4DA